MPVVVSMLIDGDGYAAAAAVALRALLKDTPFHIFAVHTPGLESALPRHRRLNAQPLPALASNAHRARRFLRKFEALALCLKDTTHDWILQLDADVVLARPLRECDLARALAGADLGMVEQTGIRGSAMNRASFLDHYTRHTLALLAPGATPPPETAFRFFNSGVVIGPRSTWTRLVPWALERIAGQRGEHQVGEHMIADQDYFQFWANTLHPGSCRELPWYWNHCEYWDDPFPRRGVLFAHFSNFCQGPATDTPGRMRALRRPWSRLINRCIPRSLL